MYNLRIYLTLHGCSYFREHLLSKTTVNFHRWYVSNRLRNIDVQNSAITASHMLSSPDGKSTI